MDLQNTERFSNRVDDYVKYRPGYPPALIRYLEEEQGLIPGQFIADIGAGTGISSSLFLRAGYRVFGVEPNKEMREKAIELLNDQAAFIPVEGTAEQTNLDSESVDLVIAAQAFHWFDHAKAKKEFRRILRPNGKMVLLWNQRLTDTPFEQAYDEVIIRHGNKYVEPETRFTSADIDKFYSPGKPVLKVFSNKQEFNFEGLKGRLLSSSYMPARNEAGYDVMVKDLETVFIRFQDNGLVRLNYNTNLVVGPLN
ncbi:MAG: class I SAM-dependent methyltransferase [Chitinophagaceae bacterium]